jgi:hypothetical protein
MRDAFFGEDPVHALADPETGLAEWVSSSTSRISVPRGPIKKIEKVAAISSLASRLAIPAIRFVVLIWALILPQSITVGSVAAPDQRPPSDRRGDDVTVVQHPQSCPNTGPAKIRPHRRTNFISHFSKQRPNNPDDDAATDNSTDDDDDVWEDLNAEDTSDELLFVWTPEFARFFTLHEVGFAPVWHEITSSPFLPPQRLRC